MDRTQSEIDLGIADALQSLESSICERDRQLLALRLKSPLRPGAVDARDAAHLPLFVAANEPGLGL